MDFLKSVSLPFQYGQRFADFFHVKHLHRPSLLCKKCLRFFFIAYGKEKMIHLHLHRFFQTQSHMRNGEHIASEPDLPHGRHISRDRRIPFDGDHSERRRQIAEHFATEIENLYKGHGA